MTAIAWGAALVLALGACSAQPAEDPSEAPDAEPTSAAPAESEPAESASSDDDAAMTELMAVVGTEDDPEAYEIALTDADGAPVTSLPAGDYSITFVDRSTMHNFHMTGPGDVDLATDVAGSDETTVEVTLVAGTYDYLCDPHPTSMAGSLEVTE